MKNIVRKAIRDEKGQAMLLAVILLLVCGLVVASLLSFMGTGLLVNPVYEGRVAELYGADAGVEDAVLKIQLQVPEIQELYCGAGNHTWTYPEEDEPPMIVNGKSVEVTIAYVNNTTYRVESTATGDGSGTKVDAYVTGTALNYSKITDYILCSQGELEWGNKVVLNYTEGHGPEDYYKGYWPTAQELKNFYWQDVEDEPEYSSGTIDLNGNNMTFGPIYRIGTLDILNSGTDEATLSLDGTLYITGDISIGQTNKDFTLDLNGQTIFVESNSADALIVSGKCTVRGPGAIIAIGDIYFAPKGDVGNNGEPVFIFSVLGTTKLQPSGDFYGAIAGSIWVDVQQGKTPTIIYPPGGFEDDDLNFPGFGDFQLLVYSIASWEVTPLSPQDFAE